MKKIGILGGMSPESTALYYEHITHTYTARFGDYGYPEILIYSVNFQRIVECQRSGRWDQAACEMANALESLRRAGADFGLIATNTMHFVFDQVQNAVGMPLLSIVDSTVSAISRAGFHRVGLLGSLFTMRERFFAGRLEQAGISALTPCEADQQRVHDVIFDELCRGEVRPESKEFYLDVVEKLRGRGAEGVILGCTEIPLILKPGDAALPLFNTTLIHAENALEMALEN